VDALAEMSISGNVTPVNWYKTILRENGKPYLLAICVLSEIVYWYRPVEVRDEHSGMTIGYRRKFREDLLQKTYNTSGASHVGIYVGNGMMIHCGNPISYASIETSYWRQHYYCMGRIR
jgi:hypothetical protein